MSPNKGNGELGKCDGILHISPKKYVLLCFENMLNSLAYLNRRISALIFCLSYTGKDRYCWNAVCLRLAFVS